MATMTLGEAMADLRDRLDEAPGDESSGVWTNVALRRCINRGVREVARRAECMEKTGTVSISAGTQSGTLPTDLVRIRKAEWYTSASGQRVPLEYRQRENLDRIWGWSQVTQQGRPEFWTVDGYPGGSAHNIVLFPTPSSTGTVKVFYYYLPADLATDGSADATNLSLPYGWEDVALDFAEYRAFRMARDVNSAQGALARFTDNLSAIASASNQNYVADQPSQIIYDPQYPIEAWGVF